jgi:predicted PurR-regulated permease PerM
MTLNPELKEFAKRIILLLSFAGGLYLIFQLRFVILLLFLVTVVSYTLLPFVEYFEKFKIPRAITTLGILLLALGFVSGIAVAIASALGTEYNGLVQMVENNYASLASQYGLEQFLGSSDFSSKDVISQLGSALSGSVSSGLQGALGFGSTIFGALFTLLTAVTILFYLMYDPHRIADFVISLLPEHHQPRTKKVARHIQHTLSKWLQGQFLLMFIMAVISYIGFLIIGVPYPLVLAILVGVLDIVPVIGPLIALIPVLLVTVFDSPVKAIFVLIFFFMLQIIEGNVLVPRVMSKTVGLDSLYVIIALLVGSSLGGALGGLLAIPASVILKILYEEFKPNA